MQLKNCDASDIENNETQQSMNNWLQGNFGLKPHKVNYILPFGYREGTYKSYVPSDEYRNIEAELQVSLKINVGKNLFGLNENYYMAYTHRAFWQIYSRSSPFRETNYNPEIFVIFPILDDSKFGMRSLEVGLAHLSNGQGNNENVVYANPSDNPGNRSRSVNYMYSKLTLQHGSLISDFKLWVPYFGTDLSDNPDLMDYTGYVRLKLSYFLRKHLFTVMGRGNLVKGRGAMAVTYSYPMIDDVFFYAKVFSGYEESLIDYNNYITKFSIGFSFSR